MACKYTRRQALAHGFGALGAMGALAMTPRNAAGAESAALTKDLSAKAPAAPVAVRRCESYEPKLLREQLDAALDAIGGIGDLVSNKTVTVKLNLTGALKDMHGLKCWDTFQTHPQMTAALCAALHDAGAKRIVLLDGLYFKESAEEVLSSGGWDLNMIQSAGGHKVQFVNSKNLEGFKSYSRMPVSYGGFLFPEFLLNGHYEKTDVFVSLGKMKDHETAGVTMTVKNLFGITPTALYGNDAPNEDSTLARVNMLHAASRDIPAGVPGELGAERLMGAEKRVPRIVADCLGARPVDLAIIEGILTIKGGEGFWNKNTAPVAPKLLMAGRNAVCTDAVCTAIMGYNPMAAHNSWPFPGENHLAWCAQAGLGTNDPSRIDVRGLSIAEAKFPFRSQEAEARRRVNLEELRYRMAYAYNESTARA